MKILKRFKHVEEGHGLGMCLGRMALQSIRKVAVVAKQHYEHIDSIEAWHPGYCPGQTRHLDWSHVCMVFSSCDVVSGRGTYQKRYNEHAYI